MCHGQRGPSTRAAGRDRLPTTRLLIGQRFSRRSLMLGCGSKYSRHVLRLARRAWVVVRPENAQHIIVRELLRVEFYPHRFGVAVAGAHGGVGGCAAACVWTARVPDGRAHNAIHAAEQRVGPPKSAHAKHSHCNTPLAHRAKQNVSAISQTKNMRGEGVGGQSSLSMGAPTASGTLLRVLSPSTDLANTILRSCKSHPRLRMNLRVINLRTLQPHSLTDEALHPDSLCRISRSAHVRQHGQCGGVR